jgi:hypothetical protein
MKRFHFNRGGSARSCIKGFKEGNLAVFKGILNVIYFMSQLSWLKNPHKMSTGLAVANLMLHSFVL